MKGIFNPENPLFKIMAGVADLILLNLLWVAGCLPLITAGASTTALCAVTMKLATEKPYRVLDDFWRSFKRNFRQATLLWILYVAVLAVLLINFYLCQFIDENAGRILVWVLGVAIFLVVGMAAYAFPMLAVFEVKLKALIKNAAILIILKLPITVLLVFLSVLPILLVVLVRVNLMGVFVASFIGVAVCALAGARLLRKVFAPLMPAQEGPEDAGEPSD